MPTYNQLVDHLVTTMKPQSQAPFDTEAYANYKAQVDQERKKIENDIVESIYQLGYKIDTACSKIISQLDELVKDDFNPDNVTCSVDDEQVDCETWEKDNDS